jgi:mannose-6-phosphate isomerase-like protein (cupin superfamily)
MKGYVADIEDLTEDNENFRQVLYTGKNLQLVLMALKPGEEIGAEVHATHDQFFRVEKGKGKIVIDGNASTIKSGFAMIVPAGAKHNVVNTGEKVMHLYTIYAPPQHADGIVAVTRAAAETSHEHFDGKTTE